MKRLFVTCACATMLCSCYTSRILVGDVSPKEPMIEVAKNHDAHFIGGLVKTAKNVAEEHIGNAPNYMIRSQYGFGDILLSTITAGIYTPTTTKYFIPVRHLDSFSPGTITKLERPDKTNGLILMTGANFIASPKGYTGITLDAVVGYKFWDQFIVGIGVNGGIGGRSLTITEGDNKGHKSKQGWNTLLDGVVRCRYLIFNKSNTPYANLDIGVSLSNQYYAGGPVTIFHTPIKPSAVITPSIGYQYKVRKNVYLNAGIGYRFDTGIKVYEDWNNNCTARVYSGGFQFKFGVNFML